MSDLRIKAGLILVVLVITLHGMPVGRAGEVGHSEEQNLQVLSLMLELTPDQHRQATELIKISEAAKNELRSKLREKFDQLNEIVRDETPRMADIKPLCQELGGLQEQLILRDAKTQIAFRRILNHHQRIKLDRMEKLGSGLGWMGRRRGIWSKDKGKDD